MSPVQKTGLYYPNKFGLIIIKSLEEVMGKNGINAILNLGGLNNYIDNYPLDNLDKGFDFAELSGIGVALEEMYGPRGGRGLALRAGRATFSDALKNFGALAGAADLAFVVLPLQSKLRIGLPAFAKIFSQLSDQYSTVEEKGLQSSSGPSISALSAGDVQTWINRFVTSLLACSRRRSNGSPGAMSFG